ncbi:antibiotic biosynthesis monooxygenase [Streptomyces sp. NPDC006655]|uniref:antibiotic biosynthesis monooxygenase family protein n=1 Tax=Streptomyces sp. NPDC006655 TaxID=3156898 RepID=UPI00345184E8
MSVYVMVSARIKPGTSKEFEQAFEEVRAKVGGTPGHLGEQLLRHSEDPERYTLLGHWESTEKFLAWEDAPIHRENTVPLRPFWAGPVERVIHEIAVDRAGTGARP